MTKNDSKFETFKRIWILVMVIWLMGPVVSRADSVPVITVAGTIDKMDLIPEMGYKEDKDGLLTIEDLTGDQGAGVPWTLSEKDTLNLGFTESVYWLKGNFRNRSNKDLSYLIEFAYPILDDIEIFYVDGNSMTSVHLGDRLPYSQRLINQTNFLYPVTFPAGKTVSILMRVKTTSSMQIPLIMYTAENYLVGNQVKSLLKGCYFGAMIIMIIYNLFILVSARDVSYLFYVLYVLSVVTFYLGIDGVGYRYLWPRSIIWNDKAIFVAVCGIVDFASLFAMSFLVLKKNRPIIFSLFLIYIVASSLIIFFSFKIPYKFGIKASILLGMTCSMVLMFYAILRWIEGYSPAKIYTISWAAAHFGAIVISMEKIGVVPRNQLTENAMQIGTVVEVMLLSFALAYRLNLEKKERIEAQTKAHMHERNARIANENALVQERKAREAQEQALAVQKRNNEILEMKVQERTLDLKRSLADIQEVNSKIMSSLRYARMIQLAILPDQEKISVYFPDHFILWKPRDIVGGDFYYMDNLGERSVAAVVDCTGHGVSGAFMTFIVNSELKRLIHGEKCYDPGEIIAKMKDRIKTTLKYDFAYGEYTGGFDIALCMINHAQGYIEFAGSYLGMTYIRNHEIHTIKGQKKKHADIYDVSRISIVPGMAVYLSTDGFTDQPGERNGLRFGGRSLGELILKTSDLPLNNQCEHLLATFEAHRGQRDQVDDLTVVCFRFQEQLNLNL